MLWEQRNIATKGLFNLTKAWPLQARPCSVVGYSCLSLEAAVSVVIPLV